jgi:biotin synthase
MLRGVRQMSAAAVVETQHAQSNTPRSSMDLHPPRSDDGSKILRDAVAAQEPRHNWTREEISAIYYQPLMELAYQAVRLRPPT